jgi:predicted transposase/invertase (TIGR01784 family)
MGTGIDPKVDYAFKRILGDEDNALLLVDLLNAVLDFPPGRRVIGVALLNPFVPGNQAEGKIPILDVRARDDPGRQFLLEMQQFVPPAFGNRLLYYWAVAHAEQMFRGDRYELLQPTYSICFLNEVLLPDVSYRHRFRVYDDEHGVLWFKGLEIHLLELSKFEVPVEEVKTSLERWLYFFRHGASLDPGHLPATLDVPVIRQAVEVLVKISQSELEHQRYLEQQRIERDAANIVAAARVAEENARTARKVGLDQGKVIGRIQLLQQLLAQPETASDELEQLSEQALEQLEESLKRQLSAPKPANGSSPTEKT